MGYAQVDINQIKLDQPQGRYVPVDVNQIKLDQPAPQSPQAQPTAWKKFSEGAARGAANATFGLSQLTGTENLLYGASKGEVANAVQELNAQQPNRGWSGFAGEMMGDPRNWALGLAPQGLIGRTVAGAVYGASDPSEKQTLKGQIKDKAINAGTDAAMFAGLPIAINKVGEGVSRAASGVGNIIETKAMGKGLAARGAEEMDDATQAMKDQSSVLYKQSKDAGALINKNKGVNIVNKMQNKIGITSDKAVHSKLYGDTLSVVDDMKAAAQAGNLSLEDIDGYRQLLNDAVSKNHGIMGVNGDGKKALDAIHELDDAIESLMPIDIIGGDTGAVDSLVAGRAQWAKARKFETVTQVIKNANGDPNKIKAGFQRLLKDKRKTRGFTPEEIQTIEEASKNTINESIMKGLGRFGLAPENVFMPSVAGGLGAMSGAGLPAGALVGAGTVARQGQKLIARGKAENVLQKIESRQVPRVDSPKRSISEQMEDKRKK